MREAMQQVGEFHRLIGADDIRLLEHSSGGEATDDRLRQIAVTVNELATKLKMDGVEAFKVGDARLLRSHLILEEASEFVLAVANRDEVGALDALCDLLYVVVGSGVTMDLPLHEGFEEVHRSNMTKRPPKGDVRAMDKGKKYRPPDLVTVLRRHRGGL